MLSIFATTDLLPAIDKIIASEERLSELVEVFDSMKHLPTSSGQSLIIDSAGIKQPIDWHNITPPYLLPNPISLHKDVLLGMIFHLLGNSERAWHCLNNHPELQSEIGIITRLQHGYQIQLEEIADKESKDSFDSYRSRHNESVIRHYGYLDVPQNFKALKEFYQKALDTAPNSEYRAFTAKHYASLLLDIEALSEAEAFLEATIPEALSDDARYSLRSVLISVWMKQLTIPYDEQLLEKLKTTLWDVLQYFESNQRTAEAALLLVDAAHIANISGSFSESLGYISKAIRIFEEEELIELAGNAQLRKGTLLYTWAQNGNPQFYKPAIEAYHEALKIFRQEVTPDVFADIHHNLAVLYSEMPADSKKRGIWAGVASASFQEALNFYTKEQYPYEYGMICNNFGNALTKFPPAIHSDNYEKALFYYSEALHVRTESYPYERAITLLNFLEASWNVSNRDDSFNKDRYQDMMNKAQEVMQLVREPDMVQEAQKHLDMLKELKQAVSK